MMDSLTLDTNTKRNKIHPHKFALWLSLGSITMMFVAFTSAYMVKQAAGNWLDFAIPSIFYISTVVLIISSMTMHFSYKAYSAGNKGAYKMLLLVSLILGITFIVLQYKGWMELFGLGVDLKRNVSGSFFYLITSIHAAHILGGIAAITVATLRAFVLKFKVTEKRKLGLSLICQYWHYVDFLWIYLLGFLLLNR